jgi:hypothetical protein
MNKNRKLKARNALKAKKTHLAYVFQMCDVYYKRSIDARISKEQRRVWKKEFKLLHPALKSIKLRLV